MMRKFFVEEEGQSLIEYGLLVSLMALIVIGVMTFIGRRIQTALSNFL